MENFLIILGLGLGGRVGNDGKRHSPRTVVFPSPQAYGQETFTVKAARKGPLRRRETYYSRRHTSLFDPGPVTRNFFL